MNIRPMECQDVKQVAALEQQTFSQPWSEHAFLDMVDKENVCYLVAEENDDVVGYCGVHHVLGEGEITNVAVAEKMRNRGIGYAMLTELFERGRQMGVEAFTLEVRAGNAAAIHMYEKLGFVTEGIRKNFYEKPREDALIMWKR